MHEYLNIRIDDINTKPQTEAAVCMCSKKKVPQACNLMKKETLARVFPCEFCETLKNDYERLLLHRIK